MSKVLDLTKRLVACPSLTPNDAGCIDIITTLLQEAGFACQSLPFEDVSNLWATHGTKGPTLCLVGHTDVVPTGDESQWLYPPFQPTEHQGHLYGRGACDMKGSLAALVVAACEFAKSHPKHKGRLALLITSDEEGKSIHGTKRVAEWLKVNHETIEYVLVGEPSSTKMLGDTIKIGRRGTLSGYLTVHGIQGHVAYPHLAKNPIHEAFAALNALVHEKWDQGHPDFPATSLQFSNIHAGTGANNVIPGTLEAVFNFRYNPSTDKDQLIEKTESILKHHALEYTLNWHHSGDPFITDKNHSLVQAAVTAIQKAGLQAPLLSTSGGTSDGRFLAPLGAAVVELGPINDSIHKINENVSIKDLETLTPIYLEIIKSVL